MFDLGMFELMIVGVLMILVLGPKELPRAMRAIARVTSQMRKMASEFQGHMDDLAREADLAEARDAVKAVSPAELKKRAAEALDPGAEMRESFQKMGRDMSAMSPKESPPQEQGASATDVPAADEASKPAPHEQETPSVPEDSGKTL